MYQIGKSNGVPLGVIQRPSDPRANPISSNSCVARRKSCGYLATSRSASGYQSSFGCVPVSVISPWPAVTASWADCRSTAWAIAWRARTSVASSMGCAYSGRNWNASSREPRASHRITPAVWPPLLFQHGALIASEHVGGVVGIRRDHPHHRRVDVVHAANAEPIDLRTTERERVKGGSLDRNAGVVRVELVRARRQRSRRSRRSYWEGIARRAPLLSRCAFSKR